MGDRSQAGGKRVGKPRPARRTTARGLQGRPRVEITLATAADVGRSWREHLSLGGVLGPDVGAEQVRVVLRGPAGTFEFDAKAVLHAGPEIGYELLAFRERKGELEAWVDACCAGADDDVRTTTAPRRRAPSRAPKPDTRDTPDERATRDATVRTPPLFIDPPPEPAPAARPSPLAGPLPKNALERVRRMSAAEQLRLARTGERDERIALERVLGKAVWDGLLHNPRITTPEVAAIARMGTLPTPLLEFIVGNAGWLRAPEIRRAVLSNPRLAGEQIARVLRAMPKAELRLMPLQSAYPAAVREAAKRLLP
jgi:hypothetical protein